MSIGGADSGTQVLAKLGLKSLVPGGEKDWQTLTPMAREALLHGDIDAMFVVEAWNDT